MTDDPDKPRAFFDGKVLHDPDGLAVFKAVAKHNCLQALRDPQHRDRVVHFTRRIAELGLSPRDVVIVVLNVDAPLGAELADVLMPGHDWNAYRARGEVPFARGLATREGIEYLVADTDAEVGRELRAIDGVAVVTINFGVVAAFKVGDVVLDQGESRGL